MAQLDTTELGSVGTVVGAVMETAGHFMQSAFIDLLEGGLGTSLGSLLYLTAILTALTIIAIGGNYKFGKWFLFGPILFYALVFARVDSCGVVVRHGERVVSPEVIWDKTKGLANISRVGENAAALSVSVPENGNLCEENPARISAIFEMWNNLTSSVINGLVKLLRLDNRGADFDFVTKVDRFTNLFTQNIDDPIVADLVTTVIQTPCGPAFATAHQILAPNLSIHEEKALTDKFQQELAHAPINPKEIPQIARIIEQRATTNPDLNKDGLLSCQELWGLAVDVLKTNSLSIFASIADVGNIEDKDERSRETIKRLANKFALAYDTKTGQLLPTKNKEAIVGVINEKAVRLFLDKLRQLNPSLRKGDLGATEYLSLVGNVGGADEMADAIRSSSSTEEYREKGRFLQMMLALPYAQGVMLYFLAMLYPFFCVFAILPGRHETVMMWFGLWFWVKLWDFGFAVVMLIDELMYTLMPHSPYISNEALADPVASFKAALSVDPTYSVHIYYNILASCLAAVPILTAGAVRKGTGPLLQALNSGFSNFAGNPGGAMRSYAGNIKSNSHLAQARTMQQNMLTDALFRRFQGSNVSNEMIAATAMQAGASLMSGSGDVAQIFTGLANKATAAASDPTATAEQKAKYNALAQKYAGGRSWVESNPGGKGLAAYFDAKGDQTFRIALARHTYEVASDVYKQSTERGVDYINADARQLGYYDHPFRAGYPSAQYFSIIQQQESLETRKPLSAVTQGFADWIFR